VTSSKSDNYTYNDYIISYELAKNNYYYINDEQIKNNVDEIFKYKLFNTTLNNDNNFVNYMQYNEWITKIISYNCWKIKNLKYLIIKKQIKNDLSNIV